MYTAFITKLKNVRKHSNADRLQVAECFGNSVIIGLDMKDGDVILYFPVDGQLEENFARKNNLLRIKDAMGNNTGGYLDENKRNITALKLRGEKSDGLVMPLNCLSDYCDISTLKEGDMISVLNGITICQKYVPIRKNQNYSSNPKNKTKVKKEKSYLFFEEHIDTAQLAYNKHQFKEGDSCYITLKMHGTSARTGNAYFEKKEKQGFLSRLFRKQPKITKGFEYVSGTRRVVLNNMSDGGYYGTNKFRETYHNFFKGKLYEGEEIFYEIVGYADDGGFIMGECENSKVDKLTGDKEKNFVKKYGDKTQFTYGCEKGKNDIYVYRMTMTTSQGVCVEYPWERVVARCEQMGVKAVPQFDKFIFSTEEDLTERVVKFEGGIDPIGKSHIREGVVVRIDNRLNFTAYKHKNFEFKVLEGIIKDNADAPDMEEMEEET